MFTAKKKLINGVINDDYLSQINKSTLLMLITMQLYIFIGGFLIESKVD